jgi:hypothetical protein
MQNRDEISRIIDWKKRAAYRRRKEKDVKVEQPTRHLLVHTKVMQLPSSYDKQEHTAVVAAR